MSEMIKCRAKINLGLRVLGRRSDGFHELETTMHEIDLCDDLYVTPFGEGGDELVIDGLPLAVEKDNLLFRCLAELRSSGVEIPSLSMNLLKRIPMGGGLGGGSSDAVGLLCWLRDRYGVSASLVERVAARLGSDTNFFIEGGTAVCRGRGEQVQALGRRDLNILLILPPWSCSTPKVFSATDPSDWVSGVENHLLEACCRAYPEMASLIAALLDLGVGAKLSGSGSTLFIVDDDKSSLGLKRDLLAQTMPGLKLMMTSSYHRP
jgi:4-diphosphocytidyl-2-C-methyl-D-erythritol kinase